MAKRNSLRQGAFFISLIVVVNQSVMFTAHRVAVAVCTDGLDSSSMASLETVENRR